MSTGTDSPPEMTELKAKEGRGAWIQVLGAFLVYVATWCDELPICSQSNCLIACIGDF